MKHHLAIATALVAALGATTPSLALAQNPPAQTYEPGFWQPVARYNPNSRAEVRLVNRTGRTLFYDLTSDDATSRRLRPGATVLMTNIRPDSYVLVYSEDTSEQGGFPVEYRVSADANRITATISRGATLPGDQTLHLHGNGGIFVY
ncbi:MAG: hypothetical protein SW833_06955 [Cyanobacteriota bacterium]|nr:hypothetical protein [Cyanobacteriota bacterium]